VAKPKRLRLLLLVVLGLAALALAAVAWRTDTHGLKRRLVDDVKALAAALYTRAVHAPPTLAGRFGAQAADPWTQLAALEAVSTDVEFCRAVRDGETAVGMAPPSCLRELARGEVPLQALLLATHASAGGPPLGLGTLDLPAPAEAPRTFVTAAYAARMAALQVRVQLGKGDTQGALSTCLDLLALARDTSLGTALQGRLAALSISEVAFAPCAAALDAATVEEKRAAAVALSKLAQGTPPLAETLSEWSTRVRALRFSVFLSPDVLSTLPEGVKAWARAEDVPRHLDVEEALALGNAWHALQSRLDSVVAAARLPAPRAAERLSALSARTAPDFAGLGHVEFPELGWIAQSDARVRAELLLLRRAAEVDVLRAETGAWPLPEALPEAVRSTSERPFSLESKGPEAVLRDGTSPRGGLELLLHADR